VSRCYRDETGILETHFETPEGNAKIVDFMALSEEGEDQVDLIRLVYGEKGQVRMRTEIVLRFDYARSIPWVRQHLGGPVAVAGPNAIQFVTPVALRGTPDMTTVGEFTVEAGEMVPFTMSWYPSHHKAFRYRDPYETLLGTETRWHDWSSRCTLQGPWREAIIRSLITLRMLTYGPTGGIVAALTTSLPEWIGSVRNWDYRFCWIRDATLTLYALLSSGYRNEARAWREWLMRAAAGHPSEMQIMYGLAGERRLTEYEIPWLPGYGGSRPVRGGNAAHEQLQLDVYGELMDALHAANRYGLEASPFAWSLQVNLLEYLETIWEQPDQGIWEIRGEARHFTFSKVMAWVAFDRAIKSAEQYGFEGPRAHWEDLRRGLPRRSSSVASTAIATPSSNTTALAISTPRCCLSRRSGFCRPKTRGSAARSKRSSASCCRTASCAATPVTPEPTGCRPAKACSLPAAFGSPTASR
jgi:GH15 family glucan-1,4-alpha-glucosidase